MGNGLVFICNIDFFGRFESIDPAFERFLGYRRGSLVGKSYADIIDPDEKWKAMRYYVAVLKDEEYDINMAGYILSKNGEKHLFRVIPHFDFENGTPVSARVEFICLDGKG